MLKHYKHFHGNVFQFNIIESLGGIPQNINKFEMYSQVPNHCIHYEII